MGNKSRKSPLTSEEPAKMPAVRIIVRRRFAGVTGT
jgi:hypothetical protein